MDISQINACSTRSAGGLCVLFASLALPVGLIATIGNLTLDPIAVDYTAEQILKQPADTLRSGVVLALGAASAIGGFALLTYKMK